MYNVNSVKSKWIENVKNILVECGLPGVWYNQYFVNGELLKSLVLQKHHEFHTINVYHIFHVFPRIPHVFSVLHCHCPPHLLVHDLHLSLDISRLYRHVLFGQFTYSDVNVIMCHLICT